MKTLFVLALVILSVALVGCGQEQPLPDTPASKPQALKPGEKPKDVLLPIDK